LPFSFDIIRQICLLNITGTDVIVIVIYLHTYGYAVRCGSPEVKTNPLIFHGRSTAQGQWPWHAALYQHQGDNKPVYQCGGSFVGTRTIITGKVMYCQPVKLMEKTSIDLLRCVCVCACVSVRVCVCVQLSVHPTLMQEASVK
jgi:hypothetical protein